MSHHGRQNTPHDTQPPSAASKARPGASVVSAVQPTHDRIRARAYEISQSRHGAPGHESADWEKAEAELKAELARPR